MRTKLASRKKIRDKVERNGIRRLGSWGGEGEG